MQIGFETLMLKRNFLKYKEVILYLFFGGLTTLVNVVTYWVLANPVLVNYLVSNAIALILSILFAYVTNKIYVFESKVTGFDPILREFVSFMVCRLFSALVDMGIMYTGVSLLHANDLVTKIVANIIVVILNYAFSKLFIFKKQENK